MDKRVTYIIQDVDQTLSGKLVLLDQPTIEICLESLTGTSLTMTEVLLSRPKRQLEPKAWSLPEKILSGKTTLGAGIA